MKFLQTAICLTVFFALSAWAGSPETAEDKPSFSASRTLNFGAEVTAINHETREVTLKGPEGESVSFVASDHVRNLQQVEVGDLVLAEVYEEIDIEVMANPEGVQPGAGEVGAAVRAEAGAMPGAGVMESFVLTAIVEEINLENNTFKLRGPEGNIKEFAARNPENLRRADVGDLVVISVTVAAGILVEHPEAE